MNSEDKFRLLLLMIICMFVLASVFIVGYFDTKQKQIELEKIKIEQVIKK